MSGSVNNVTLNLILEAPSWAPNSFLMIPVAPLTRFGEFGNLPDTPCSPDLNSFAGHVSVSSWSSGNSTIGTPTSSLPASIHLLPSQSPTSPMPTPFRHHLFSSPCLRSPIPAACVLPFQPPSLGFPELATASGPGNLESYPSWKRMPPPKTT